MDPAGIDVWKGNGVGELRKRVSEALAAAVWAWPQPPFEREFGQFDVPFASVAPRQAFAS
jgi:hypothetical protein